MEKTCGLYPGLASFSRDYDADDYSDWVEQSNGDPLPAPLALYVQESSDVGSSHTAVSAALRLNALELELAMQGKLFDSDRPLQQLVLSSSLVIEWDDDQLHQLVSVIRDSFTIHETGVENGCACVGSASPDVTRLKLLSDLGFNKVRFSLLDRTNIGRSLDELGESIGLARQFGFSQVAIDLPVGVLRFLDFPQTVEAWLTRIAPDRIRLTGIVGEAGPVYTHMLSTLGYRNIGLDCYLKTDDVLMRARGGDRLHWSLLGFTDMTSPDVIGIGPGAISSIGEFYAANESDWTSYQDLLQQGHLPIVRGIELEADDVLRREIMVMILAGSCIHIAAIEAKWGIRFNRFFAAEVEQLRVLERNHWLDWQHDDIHILVRSREELAEICHVFDHRSCETLAPLPTPISESHRSSLK
ncbi:MAG TPA: hypothetical protein ENJ80_06050 [Gammaproteobacteria bacterium]|nr:hypothetical protein [Gammaproteobacteria bacterium]